MFELIHTSAPRGLFGGSGYTTVAATQGMPDALRKVLESLSGYEQVFEYGSPQFQSNPEAYICQPIGQAAGKSWWVISRIVVADKDYTGRSNYLAHHVALDYNELTQAGPVALARTFPWMSSWAGEPRMLPVRSMPRLDAPAPPMAAPAWTRAGLDAGWAGHLAEQARSRRGIIQLVYPQTVDPLTLIADAVALLPPAERWDARFHTHTSRPRPDQAWAWFPAEAGATTDLARRPGVVYLAMRPPCPTAGPLVDQARGKAASIPAMGGAGNLNFHGSHGNAGLPVATAVATSTDPYAPAGRGAAGSWGAPPVPKKGSLVGPILHWTAHGLMVVVMLVLAAMWLLEMQTVRKKDAEITKISGEKKSSDEIITKKDAEIVGLSDFKTKLKIATKCSAEELEGFGEIDTLVSGKMMPAFAKRLRELEAIPDKKLVINSQQLSDPQFELKEKVYMIPREAIIDGRKNLEDLKKSNAIQVDGLNKIKSDLEMKIKVYETKNERLGIDDLLKLQLDKSKAIELEFQLSDEDIRFLKEADECLKGIDRGKKSLRMLALGLRPVDMFPVFAVKKFCTDLEKSKGRKPDFKEVLEEAHRISGNKPDQISPVTVLLVRVLLAEFADKKPSESPNYNSYWVIWDKFIKNSDNIKYIENKVKGLQP